MCQLIMCVIFGVCKLEDENPVSFRRIIDVHSHIATNDKFMDLTEGLYWTVHIGPAPDQVNSRCSMMFLHVEQTKP